MVHILDYKWMDILVPLAVKKHQTLRKSLALYDLIMNKNLKAAHNHEGTLDSSIKRNLIWSTFIQLNPAITDLPAISENPSITETILKFLREFSLLSILVITGIRLQQIKMVGPLISVRVGVNYSFILNIKISCLLHCTCLGITSCSRD